MTDEKNTTVKSTDKPELPKKPTGPGPAKMIADAGTVVTGLPDLPDFAAGEGFSKDGIKKIMAKGKGLIAMQELPVLNLNAGKSWDGEIVETNEDAKMRIPAADDEQGRALLIYKYIKRGWLAPKAKWEAWADKRRAHQKMMRDAARK